MYRGGATVAIPSSIPSPKLLGNYQQGSRGLQTIGRCPVWRRPATEAPTTHHSPPPPPQPPPPPSLQQPQPPVPTNSELKQKWGIVKNNKILREHEETLKPESQSSPQWKRKQDTEMKLEEEKKKIEPLWKRIREAELKQQTESKSQPEKIKKESHHESQMNMERKRPEPLWKKKPEPQKIEVNTDLGKKQDAQWRKIMPPQTPEMKNKNKGELERQVQLLRKVDTKKIEPAKKLEPIWKRKFETVKTEDTEVKVEPQKKVEPIWKKKTDTVKTPEQEMTPEANKRPEPLWKRRKEPEMNKNTEATPKQEQICKAKETGHEGKVDIKTHNDAGSSSSEEDTEEICCPMCSELYDMEEQEPIMLPRCGHTFCRPCLASIKGKGHFPCPTCRKRHLKPPVEDIPVNAEVLKKATAYWEEKTGRCTTHEKLLIYWCRDCKAPLCPSCRVKEGHDIVRSKVVLQEKRQELKERGHNILDNVLQEKKKIMDTVKTCSAQLLKVCEASVAVDDSSKDVKAMLSDTKQTADLGFVLSSLQRMKSILSSFTKSSNESGTDGNKTPRSRRRKEQRGHQDAEPTNEDNIESQKKMIPNDAETSVHKTTDVRQQTTTTTTTTVAAATGLSGSGPCPQVISQGPLLSMADSSLWPLTCCVYGDDGRRARLAWHDGRLHMSALTENEDEAHFMIKLSVIQSVIPQDQPEVFLEVAAGDQILGRIYIKLWGHLRRAHHFLALCMGTHGPSYRGAKFEEVFSRGLKGECLHAGPYLTPSGGLSAQRVMDGLEWDGQFKEKQRKGLVVGAGSGRPDRESCFDICTIENPTRHFACPFGEVVGGWDTVMAIIDYRPVRAVTMVDVGVVVPGATHPCM